MTDNAEIARIHKRLDDLVDIQGKQAVAMARIALAAEFARDAHKRPCSDHEALKVTVHAHIEEQAAERTVWRSAWVRSIVHVVELAGVGAFVWIMSK